MLPHDPGAADVALVHWPQDDDTRRRLQAAGVPRLLLVAPGEAPPVTVDELEDWIRLPLDAEEYNIRVATLLRRVDELGLRGASLLLDEDNVLHRGDRWVALPLIEARVFAVLLERSGQVVHRDELRQAAWPDTPPADERAIDGAIKRLRRHLTPLGVHVHTVTGKGFLLDRRA